MEEMTPFELLSGFVQQYDDTIGIIVMVLVPTIVVVLILVKLLKRRRSSVATPSEAADGTPPEASPVEPSEPLLIHCPACGAEVSRYAPTCIKCGHPIHAAVQTQEPPQAERCQTIVIQQPPARSSNGAGTAGFVLALISLFLSWMPGVGWVVWFLGFLLSFIGLFSAPRGLAVAGFIISIIDLIILLLFFGALAALLAFL